MEPNTIQMAKLLGMAEMLLNYLRDSVFSEKDKTQIDEWLRLKRILFEENRHLAEVKPVHWLNMQYDEHGKKVYYKDKTPI